VKAEGSEPIIVIENPISGLEQSGDIQISGYAISDNGINRIDIYVDGTKVGQANLGILRQDVYDKYPTISGSLNSGYNFILNSRGYTDANHDIKLELIDNNLNKYITNVSVNFRNQRTSIMGNSVYSKDQLIKYFQQNNNIKDFNYISNFVNILFEEASIEGVRADVAFVQMMKETNFLKFTGSVREWQNNFAGLGATGTVPTDPNLPYGEKFDSIQIGIRAVIQHLQCYATTLPLKLDKVDTRYGSWLRGKAPYVEWLGINENPYGTGWASDKNYGYDIVNRLNKLADITITPSIAKVTSFNVSNISYLNQSYSASASASSINGVLYRFFEIDKSTGNWKLMQDYSEKNSFTWTPTKVGQFMIAAQVKDKYSSYQVDETIAKDVTVQSDKAKVSMLNIQAEIWLNKSTEISATATSPNGVLYRFFEIDKSTGNWKLMQDYSEKNSFTWTPTKVGQFMIAVQVKDKYSGYQVDETIAKDVTVQSDKAKVSMLNIQAEIWLNKNTEISASATSPNGVLYRFFEIDKSTGNWKLMQDYSEKNSFTWTPTKVGQFMIAAQVKDKYSSYQVDETIAKDVTVQSDKAKVSMLNIQAEIWLNKSTEISATATSPNGVLYRFFEIDKSTGNWKLMQDYSEKNSFTWTPTKVGQFMIAVQVKDKYSGYQVDETIAKDVQVKSGIIVLDAGHGGYDPGATREPYYEKNLNMQIVQKLGNILTNLGYNILYTRQPSYDTFIDLDERTSYANSTNADLFLSIHHNASTSTIPDGFSAHYSSYRPEVETQDTYVVYGGVRYPFVKEVTSKVNGKLYSTIYFNDNGTIRTASIDDCTVYDPTPSEAAVKSGLLADKLVETVTSLGLDKDGADPSKDHNLFVTRKTTMPSVLLEVGYISNPTEINKISQPSFQELIAQKIAEAIKMLF
jgi:N-acetylmuramoyl-L-alanine amidase